MSHLIGKIGDNAVIFLAAVLTICGIALAFLPWGAVYNRAATAAAAPPSGDKSIVFVDMGIGKKSPATPVPASPPK